MKIIKQSAKLVEKIPFNQDQVIESIESATRICYKSERKGDSDSSKLFLKGIFNKGHLSVFEHFSITGKFVTNRGTSHELVRHRAGVSYSQESSRYCNYSNGKFGKEVTVILPVVLYEEYENKEYSDWYSYKIWHDSVRDSELSYRELIARGSNAQIARGVLPIDLKTEIYVTANMREWWHIFNLRRDKSAHPQMVDLMDKWWNILNEKLPFFFGEIQEVEK